MENNLCVCGKEKCLDWNKTGEHFGCANKGDCHGGHPRSCACIAEFGHPACTDMEPKCLRHPDQGGEGKVEVVKCAKCDGIVEANGVPFKAGNGFGCHCPTPPHGGDWEAEFEERYKHLSYGMFSAPKGIYQDAKPDVKEFIRSSIERAKREVLEKVMVERRDSCELTDRCICEGWNACLAELKKKRDALLDPSKGK